MIPCLLILFLCFKLSYLLDPLTLEYICDSPGDPENIPRTTLCRGTTSWTYARAVDTYDYIPNSFSAETQGMFATEYYGNLTKTNKKSCIKAAKTFACAASYPYCPKSGLHISYWRACNYECEEYKKKCKVKSFDCSAYTNNQKYCFRIPKDSYYEVSWKKGPYDVIDDFYLALFLIYLVVTGIWSLLCYYYRHSAATSLIQVLVTVPSFKFFTCLMYFVIWYVCNINGRLCSIYLDVVVLFCRLLYESLTMLCLFWISEGYKLVRHQLTFNEVRLIIIFVSLYYIGNSIMLILETYIFEGLATYIITAIIYVLPVCFLIHKTIENIKLLRTQLIMIIRDNVDGYNTPVYQKYKMYFYYIVLLFFLCIFRGFAMPFVREMTNQTYKIHYYREIVDIISVFWLLIVFRFRPNEPYFNIIPEMTWDERVSIPSVLFTKTNENNEKTENDDFVPNISVFEDPSGENYVIGITPNPNNPSGILVAKQQNIERHRGVEIEMEVWQDDFEE